LRRRLLTIGHSYGIALNRRLADAMARVGADRWDVTAVAPEWLAGDLRPVPFEPNPDEANRTAVVKMRFTEQLHLMIYNHKLRDLFRSEKWDLAHIWQEPYVVSGGQAAWLAGDVPVVFYSFQNLMKHYPPPFNWLENWCVRRSAGWIAAGETIRRTLIQRKGYAERNHCTISLGTDATVFKPDQDHRRLTRATLGFTMNGPPIIGYLGRFVPEKGFGILLPALEALKTPWRALFVGSGSMEQELRSWGARFGDNVRIVTGVKHDHVPTYLNAMDLLVAPSQTTKKWREQFGRMLVEGFACGLPVIGSDSGEIPFVIGEAGKVVAEKDVAGWTHQIGELLESPNLREELSKRGRERVLQEFDWPVVARKHLTFFDEILDKTASRSEPT
jgi:glycosyltransferase involved in cell wall biosynthesis